MNALAYINDLMTEGRYTVSVQELVKTLCLSPVSAQAAIQRLRKKKGYYDFSIRILLNSTTGIPKGRLHAA